MSKVLSVSSLCLSAVTWLGVLLLYASTLTDTRVVVMVSLASAAFACAVLAVATRIRGRLAWLAAGTSLIFPVVVWEWLQSLRGDVFG